MSIISIASETIVTEIHLNSYLFFFNLKTTKNFI